MPSVGNVPALAAVVFLAATEPAIASAGIAIMNLPSSITIASVTL